MKVLERQIETLTKRAKKLKHEHGYRDAEHLERAIDRLEEAIHYINLTK